jgi:hypothetical protein
MKSSTSERGKGVAAIVVASILSGVLLVFWHSVTLLSRDRKALSYRPEPRYGPDDPRHLVG